MSLEHRKKKSKQNRFMMEVPLYIAKSNKYGQRFFKAADKDTRTQLFCNKTTRFVDGF